MFGYSASEIIGHPLDQLIPKGFSEVHRNHVETFALTAGNPRPMGRERVLEGLRQNGEQFPIEANISNANLEGQELYTVIIRDTTHRKQAEVERERLLAAEHRAREEAEAANGAKDTFLATVSHELRTPLSPILTWTQMLQQSDAPAERVRRGLEVIERCARSQAQLIEDLLDVSRIVSGKMRLEMRPVMITPVLMRRTFTSS
jgi:PAS domain S-box-containing protein